ncbi:MAG: glucose-fructose oxidoreductase [Flavobacteriaceae bacterium]|nr:glucose-fructose oxidoreductase [Flavobacteriaceae bacterium]|tara:strand:+ start:7517 stop:8596 length:1080 start_codon:yes stop_codon:yes gene_type:complete
MERRSFNKTLVSSIAGISISQNIFSHSKIRKKLGVALVGLGSYSKGALGPALLETEFCELKAIVTGTKSKVNEWKLKYNINDNGVYNYKNFESIANNDQVDIVYIVLPNNMHKEYTIKALEAGKHVICEKPMALNAEEAKEMIEVSKKVRKELFMGYRLHYDPYHLECINYCRNKTFGKLNVVLAEFGYGISNRDHWKLKKSYGGGALMDVGIYAIQAARYCTGEEPISLSAKEYKTDQTKFNEVDDTIVWQMEFLNGKVANCATSFSASMNNLHLGFEKGFAKLHPAYTWRKVSGYTSKKQLSFPRINQQALHMDGISNYLINKIPHNNVGADEGLKDMIVIDKIFESISNNGQTISL